jgi:signal transduction histidine kinase
VLLDHFLSDANAAELVAEIARMQPAPAVVVLSGLGDEAAAVELMKSGAQDYLAKDRLDARDLDNAIRAAVAHVRASAREQELAHLRDRYERRLEALVENMPGMVESGTLRELAERAVQTCVEVLAADAASCRLVDTDAACFWSTGESLAAIDLDPKRRPGRPGSAVDAQGRPVFWMWLSGETDPNRRSSLLVRSEGDASERGLLLALFVQLGTLIARRAENLYLLRSKERAVRVRDDVMAVVSHDLRGPLGNAVMACELLHDRVGEKDRAILERMANGLGHMRRLVDDLVEVVRAERGDVTLSLGEVPVRALLQSTVDLVSEAAARQQLTVTIHADELSVFADRHRLAQVFANLLSNAIRITPAGGRVALSGTPEGDFVLFRVKDSGPGVAPEMQAKIFDRFFSADHRHGLGLGLTIARSIVVAHGGRIWVESPPGEGACFCFTVPTDGGGRPRR